MNNARMGAASLACALWGLAPAAFAQSSVSVYGIADAAVRYDHHSTNVASIDKSQLVSGGSAGSRLGFRGTEDLGGGLAAVFGLEMGLSLDDGQLRQGPGFGRQSWVGLQGDWGRVTAGRQYNVLNGWWNNYNPLDDQWGIYWADPVYTGGDRFFQAYRYNNSLSYSNTLGPVKVQLDYAFGEAINHLRPGSSAGGSLVYANGPVSVGTAFARQHLADGDTRSDWTLGGKYSWEGGHYLSAGAMSTRQRNNDARYSIAFLGGGWRPTPLLLLSGAVYRFRQNAGTTAGAGTAKSVAFVADYLLSKRTSLYAEIDRTVGKDGAARSTTAYWGLPTSGVTAMGRTGTMVGIRHRF